MNTIPSKGTSARARHVSQLSSLFSFRLTFFLAISAYSGHILAQEDAPDVVTSAARTAQAVTDAQNSTTVITRADIELASSSDIASLLRQQVGVTVRQNGAYGNLSQVVIRGGDTKQTLVLVDGVPLNNLSFGSAALEQIPLSLIDRIEVVRGNVSSLYGSQATGGLIQIFTRQTKSGTQADLRLAIGDKGQKQASAQVSTGNDKWQLTVGGSHDQIKAVSAKNGTAYPDIDGYHNNSGNVSVRYTPNEHNEFGVRYMESHGNNEYDQGEFDVAKTDIKQVSLFANNQLTDHWSSQLQLSQSISNAKNINTSNYYGTSVSDDRTKTQALSWQNQVDLNVGHLVLGSSYTHQTIVNNSTYSERSFSQEKRDTSSIWAGYNLDKNRHHLQLNTRWDDVSDFNRYITGAINYGYDITPEVRAFAGYSNGFNAPSFWDLYGGQYASNENLKVEKSQYAQVGIQYDHQKYGSRMTVFRNNYKNRIYLDANWIPQNSDSLATGVEWHSWYADRGWNVDFGLTYQDVRFAQNNERWLRQPRVLANVSIGKTWKQWQAQVDWNAQGSMKDSNSKTVSGFGVLNTSLFYQPRADLRFGLTVGNVFDRKYEPLAGYNAMPRNVLFSVNYKPQW